MKTVLITLAYGFSARSVLHSGIFSRLKEAGCRIVIVCPAAQDEYLIREIAAPNVILEPIPDIHTSLPELLFQTFANTLLFNHPGTTKSITYVWLDMLARSRYTAFVGKGLAGLLMLHRSKRLRLWAESFGRKVFRHPEVADILERHQPEVLLTADLYSWERHFIREARRMGIPCASLIKGWDNLTSKRILSAHADYLLAWNAQQLEELEKLHFFPPERVFVSGSPHFDFYARHDFPKRPREEFLKSLGAPPEAKLILYIPGTIFAYSDVNNIRQLHRILQSQALGARGHLHIRKSPKRYDELSDLQRLPGITIEAGARFVPSWPEQRHQSEEDLFHQGDLLFHSDVVLHPGSTIAVDAACFDTPCIGYFLDSRNPRVPRYHRARYTFELNHLRYLVDRNLVRLARTEEELIEALRDSLHHPERAREARRKLIEFVITHFDGRCGDRIAEFLLKLAGQPGVPRAAREPSQTATKL